MINKVLVERIVSSRIPSKYGEYDLTLYSNDKDNKEHLAYVLGNVEESENVLVRVHSECFTGDVLGSRRCDCGEQLVNSLKLISEEKSGILIYMRQEGRGIGLIEKLRSYNLQDQGYDTVEANLMLGHQADSRDYSVTASILIDMKVKSIRLLTNNPDKLETLQYWGVIVNERVELVPTVTPENERYLRTKKERMNHLLQIPSNNSRPDHNNGVD